MYVLCMFPVLQVVFITREISSNIVNIFYAVILAGYAHKAHCVVLLVTVHILVVDISVHANLVYSFPLWTLENSSAFDILQWTDWNS